MIFLLSILTGVLHAGIISAEPKQRLKIHIRQDQCYHKSKSIHRLMPGESADLCYPLNKITILSLYNKSPLLDSFLRVEDKDLTNSRDVLEYLIHSLGIILRSNLCQLINGKLDSHFEGPHWLSPNVHATLFALGPELLRIRDRRIVVSKVKTSAFSMDVDVKIYRSLPTFSDEPIHPVVKISMAPLKKGLYFIRLNWIIEPPQGKGNRPIHIKQICILVVR